MNVKQVILILTKKVLIAQVNHRYINADRFLKKKRYWYTDNALDCGCFIDGSLKADGSFCTSADPCPCDSEGICTCGIGYIGGKCDQCHSGYYDVDENDSDSLATCIGIRNSSIDLFSPNKKDLN